MPPLSSDRRRTKRRRLWAIALPIVLGLLAYVVISGLVADRVSRPNRRPVVGSPADYGLSFEPVEFPSQTDQITLRGWWLPAANRDRAVVLVHGRGSNREGGPAAGITRQAQGLVAAGYNVLTFDLRAHGQSDGQRYSLGPLERRDVAAAVAYVLGRGIPPGRIALLGHSMGAATVLLTAPQTPAVGAIIADSGYAQLTELLAVQLPRNSGLPDFFNPGILLFGRLVFGIDVNEAAPIAALPAIRPRPIFFIHGDHDTYVPTDQSRRLWLASGEPPDRLWIAPAADHDRVFDELPEEYLRRVADFLAAALPAA